MVKSLLEYVTYDVVESTIEFCSALTIARHLCVSGLV